MAPVFDERDAEILAVGIAAWNERGGPRVGDWCRMTDGEMRRFTHSWGDGLQTTWRGEGGSFYFGKDGFMNYSGSLESTIPFERIEDTGETKPAAVWFFHHGQASAHNSVHVQVPCRIYRIRPIA